MFAEPLNGMVMVYSVHLNATYFGNLWVMLLELLTVCRMEQDYQFCHLKLKLKCQLNFVFACWFDDLRYDLSKMTLI